MEAGADHPEVVAPSSLEPYIPAHLRYSEGQSRYLPPPFKKKSSYLGRSGSPFLHGILLGLLSATVVLSLALGGGLGATLASCKSRVLVLESNSRSSATTTSAPTSTNSICPSSTAVPEKYRAVLPSQVNTLHNDCDASDAPTNIWGATFTTMCGRDIVSGLQSAEGGVIANVMGMTAYSFMDCMNACSGFNWGAEMAGSTTRCRAIVFATDMKNETASFLANCWLKNGTLPSKLIGLAKEVSMSAMWVKGGPM